MDREREKGVEIGRRLARRDGVKGIEIERRLAR